MEEKKARNRQYKYKSLKKKEERFLWSSCLAVEENLYVWLVTTRWSCQHKQIPVTITDQDELLVDNNVASAAALDISASKLTGKEIVNRDYKDASSVHGYKIIDADILQEVMNFCSKCKNCGAENSLSLRQDDKARRGLSEKLYLHCLECNVTIKTYTSIMNNKKLVDINLRSVYAATSSGGGLSLLRNVCGKMNLPVPVHPNPYAKYLKVILESAMQNCKESMRRAAQDIVGNNSTTTGIAVSIDGTMQKRYGPNSLVGATFRMSIDNG